MSQNKSNTQESHVDLVELQLEDLDKVAGGVLLDEPTVGLDL
nr:hypothetical protein [Okeania sp. SIO2F4]